MGTPCPGVGPVDAGRRLVLDEATACHVDAVELTDRAVAGVDQLHTADQALEHGARGCKRGLAGLDAADSFIEPLPGLGVVEAAAEARAAEPIDCPRGADRHGPHHQSLEQHTAERPDALGELASRAVELCPIAAGVPHHRQEAAERLADAHERLTDPDHQHTQTQPLQERHPDLEPQRRARRRSDATSERAQARANGSRDRHHPCGERHHHGQRLQHAEQRSLDVTGDCLGQVLCREADRGVDVPVQLLGAIEEISEPDRVRGVVRDRSRVDDAAQGLGKTVRGDPDELTGIEVDLPPPARRVRHGTVIHPGQNVHVEAQILSPVLGMLPIVVLGDRDRESG